MKRAFQRTLTCLLALVLLVTAMPSGILALAAGEQAVQITNLPTLYITLDNGAQQGEITKDGPQLPGVVSMAAEGYDPIVDAPITIKGRGNSTWTLPKKPYQIKFTEKTDLLGMGAAKKWILLANYWDQALVRNYITYNLAAKMGMAYTTECKFVDVVINGVYQGNYLLTEKIELGKERIDEDELLGGTLFELEMQYRHAEEGCPACVITNDGVHTIVKDPEPATQDELASLKADSLSFLNDMEDKLKHGYRCIRNTSTFPLLLIGTFSMKWQRTTMPLLLRAPIVIAQRITFFIWGRFGMWTSALATRTSPIPTRSTTACILTITVPTKGLGIGRCLRTRPLWTC